MPCSGIVVARLPDGGWSAPSAIGTAGFGMGGQIGAELTDFVIILNTEAAVKAFSHGGNVTLGGNLSVAAGPVGRSAEASGTIANLAAVYSYSKTKGLFAGISVEGSVILERKDTNSTFYNRKVSAKEILQGQVPPPACAKDLYAALDKRSGQFGSTVTSSEFDDNNNNYNNSSLGRSSTSAASYAHQEATSNNRQTWAGVERPPQASAATTIPRAAPPPPPQRSKTAVALYDFHGERDGDLSFKKGDLIVISKQTDSTNDWWEGRCAGRDGCFPANYVQIN